MVNKTIDTKKVINRFNDYLQCNYCNDEIEINNEYFILWSELHHLDFTICSDICLEGAIEFIEIKLRG